MQIYSQQKFMYMYHVYKRVCIHTHIRKYVNIDKSINLCTVTDALELIRCLKYIR